MAKKGGLSATTARGKDFRAALGQVAALLRDGRAGEALRLTEQLLSRHPDDSQALQLHGLAALRAGDGARAAAALARAEAASARAGSPPDPGLLTNLGVAQAAAGDLEAALASLERACAAPPASAAAFHNLGSLLRRLGRPEPAATALERALALDPRHRGARAELAAAWLDLGRWAEALTLAEALIAGGAVAPEQRFDAALAARALGRCERALHHLDALPTDARLPAAAVALERASCLQELGRWDEALAAYRAAVAAEPSSLPAVAKRIAAGARGRLPASPAALRLLLGQA